MIDPEVRRTILARVEAALDRLETGVGPPERIAAVLLEEDPHAPAPDLYALLAQMTALTREVQLRRAVHGAAETRTRANEAAQQL